MPIKITSYKDGGSSEVAWLCDDDWHLPSQVSAFEAWLVQNAARLPKGDYIADIGFAPRPEAAGGGAAIKPEMMRSMIEVGMTLFFSEYPEMKHHSDETSVSR